MNRKKYILAIDQGTSSTKTLIFDEAGIAIAKGSEPLHTSYFDNGFVEQDPESIYQNVLISVRKCLEQFKDKGYDINGIAAIGISNQRETFVVWDKEGKPLYPAVVWQCKRSVQICEELKQEGLSKAVNEKTGLVIDPYFSATKLIWLFKNNRQIKEAVQDGNIYFGTIDTWLLYKFTNGKEYATDYTNASRTLFFNLHTLQWDDELIKQFGLTGIRLPQLKPSSSLFGETTLNGILPASIPVTALIGDSHAAAFGEGCFEKGTAKATLGTGCSILMNIGDKPVPSQNGMVTTVCWSVEGRVDYALEGVIVSCGATLEWLKNKLNLFTDSRETEAMANAVADNGGVYLIPAFSGLGSPHWQMERRASITGMSFGTAKNHIVRAALESIPYQIKDVINAMESDANLSLKELNTNGGITANKFVMQFMASLLNKTVSNSDMADVSALGAAYLAGLRTGVYKNISSLKHLESNKIFYSPLADNKIMNYYKEWLNAINSK
ncbi:MAG: glycerol kinase GlpK [Sphingobacteriales bacterium]|nr:glycerol kinase GlpK [Sphingobacteriales bacterium]MBI3719608.1 glycerol kinase GlpK [Sphingobacteriales bacterium]